MLKKIKIAQFGGINTITDSSNLGVSEVRECKNFILRPLGGLSVPPAWTSFAPGGSALDLGYVNNLDYLFDGGRLLLQTEAGQWVDVTPQDNGVPNNTGVAAPGTTISSDLVLTASQYMGFKRSASNYQRLGADQFAQTWFTEPLGFVPFYTTRYTSDQAFTFGYGPVFTDSAGNKWKLFANSSTGLDAYTIA